MYRSSGGIGIRLDAGSGYAGAIISPHYDSLLVKVISHSKDFQTSCRKMTRALKEFLIRGVKTNIPFLLNVLSNKQFLNEAVNTSFISKNPQLMKFRAPKGRARKLFTYLSKVLINGPLMPLGTDLKPAEINPFVPPVPTGEHFNVTLTYPR